MSRLAKKPLNIPKGVEVTLNGNVVTAKGPKGQRAYTVHEILTVEQTEEGIKISPRLTQKEIKAEDKSFAKAISGTVAANIRNLLTGVSEGFEKRLSLVGVGYRAQLQGSALNLSLGFSHPVSYNIPAEIKIETPTQTEIVVSGIDKHLVGQVAADIRAYRPVEPYKGKGVRYKDERVILKETKKK